MHDHLRHVVCIDDDEDILRIASLALETIGGLRVETFHRPRFALADMPLNPPDLILLDVMMPEMDGPSFLHELKAQPALAMTPVVFMTARIQAADVRQYKLLGAAGVVPKPFDPVLLSSEVKAIWSEWAARRGLIEPASALR